MATVARAAGVATSTVSKALREDPTIPEDHRREIQRVARQLGYRPDPLVATLMARLHSRRRRVDPNQLAWVDLWPDSAAAARATDFRLMLRGAHRRADELGYQIDVQRVGRDGTTPARLREILLSRSQWGAIIPPVPLDAMCFPLDLQGLTAVTIGTSLHSPAMHRVAANLYQGGQLACRKLREKGFRRIGLVLSPAIHERVEGKWLGAYLAEQLFWPCAERLPPLLFAANKADEFWRWLTRARPDVILIAEPEVEEWIGGGARGSGARGRPSTAWLRIVADTPADAPAVDTRPEDMGAAAVELVVGQIHRNERGSPARPNTLLLDGVWREGAC